MSLKQQTPVLTNALLSFIHGHKQLAPHTWYLITGVTLSTINRPEEIPHVLHYATAHDVDPRKDTRQSQAERLKIARRLREGLIKSVAVVGLPKTINGLMALKTAASAVIDEPSGHSPSARAAELYHTAPSQILRRGEAFFDNVYGRISSRVMGQMDRSAEDLGLVARLMYGYLLSNLNILTAAETSFVLLAGLIPQDVNPQVKGHLKGALNNGATVEQVRAAREVIIRICEASGMSKLSDPSSKGRGWIEDVANL